MILRSWLALQFAVAVAALAGLSRPVAGVRGPHRKPLQLRGFDLKVRFDGSIARLLDAGGWLGLRVVGWLKISWVHLNSGGRFACWLLAGFDALSGV